MNRFEIRLTLDCHLEVERGLPTAAEGLLIIALSLQPGPLLLLPQSDAKPSPSTEAAKGKNFRELIAPLLVVLGRDGLLWSTAGLTFSPEISKGPRVLR